MRLENIVWDARDPRRLGGFWAAALDAETLTDEPDIVEARVQLSGEAFLDLCFPRVDVPSTTPARLHLDLRGGPRQAEVVEKLLGLGAVHADVGQGDVPWTVLADPEGNTFCVLHERDAYAAGSGPVAALPLDSADPERDAEFWAAITGWVPCAGSGGGTALRHPDGVGPLLELCPEPEPKRGKNGLHLDVRPTGADGDEDVVERLLSTGGARVAGYDGLPWQVFADPSGNEFCILAASNAAHQADSTYS
ncbi:VOC family protein [Saccharomonospora sp. CUA-673]|uniref:VOC family protein n=1 Tax=Saccharomonospora sp. CUA-673 TaxID=1904969 RepID=UPI001C9E6079|nr:VOC family protein [Saccharomonospora sp. CUA-673]